MNTFASKRAAGKAVFLAALAALFLAGPAAGAPAAADVTATYRPAEQFYRISEFFTGRENTGRDVIRRSQADERGGFYFTARLPRFPYRETVDEAVRLEVIMPGDVEATTFTFPLGPERRRNPLLLIGLTGSDWPDARAQPLAWRISFLDAEGQIFARQQSFLWGNQQP